MDYALFEEKVLQKPLPVGKALYTSLTGLSPLIGNEICYRASIDAGMSTSALSESERLHLYGVFTRMMEDVINREFHPVIIYQGKEPKEFSSFELLELSARGVRRKPTTEALAPHISTS